MKELELIEYIEHTASDILKKEFNATENAYINIEEIKFIIIDSLFYTVSISYDIGDNKPGAFEIPAVAGLPDNFWNFSEKDAFAFAIFVANLAIKIHDGILTDDDEYLIDLESKKNLC